MSQDLGLSEALQRAGVVIAALDWYRVVAVQKGSVDISIAILCCEGLVGSIA